MLRHISNKKARSGRWGWRISVLGGLAALAGALLFQPAPATIKGSPHDFSGMDSGQQICIFCHTTHNSDTSVTDAPLWNHAVTTKVYKVYSSPSMTATVDQPTGASRLCLSCHDGTIAVDSYGGKTGVSHMGGAIAVGADAADLTNDHPVSFTYDSALAAQDKGVFDPSSQPSGLGGTIAKDLLRNNRLECSSCHDVHNGPVAAAVNDKLLRITQAQSQLCLTCHNK